MSNPDPQALCQWASTHLPELREKLLGPAEETQLRAHLAGCPKCQAEAAWDERLTRQLRAAPIPGVPPDIAARVRQRLWRRRLSRIAAAAAILAVAFVWSLRGGLPDRSETDRVETPPRPLADIPESNVLFAAPPIDSLDVLARQQSAYLTALGQAKEQDR